MQGIEAVNAFKYVLSLERLVKQTSGLRTPSIYPEIKFFAVNKDSDWQPLVEGLTEAAVLDRIRWCEVFLGDLLVLRNRMEMFEWRMEKRGADLAAGLGTQQHEDKKLALLLTKGEDAVASLDICEDVMLRAVRRLSTLCSWGHLVSFESKLPETKLSDQNSLVQHPLWITRRVP